VRITFLYDSTILTVDPPQDGHGTAETHGAGGTLEFELSSATVIETTESVLVTQLLEGRNTTEPPMARGDPAMTVIVPDSQWKSVYSFGVTAEYNSSDGAASFLMIARKSGQDIQLDGTSTIVAPFGWTTVGGGMNEWEVGLIPIADDYHHMECDEPFGMQIYGLGPNVAYAHPAGMYTVPINYGGFY
jgi:hypothetical protein